MSPIVTSISRIAVASLLFVSCTPTASPEAVKASAQADSLVLERSRCFGTCPAYRLRIDGRGAVYFQSQNPGESFAATDTVPVTSVSWLLAEAQRAGYYQFPDRIMDDRTLCGIVATDHATATVTIFTDADTKRVEDYLGCYGPGPDPTPIPRLSALRRFQESIDSVAGASRWVRPAHLR